MMLLTKQNRKDLPPLYSTEKKKPEETPIIVKFFNPCGSWSGYATEFDGEDIFFGLVDGHCKELGYFSLSELKSYKGPLGIGIERDRGFHNKTLKDVM
jgi:hypothetical protein